MFLILGRREMHIGSWWESQKERNHHEDVNVGKVKVKLSLEGVWGSGCIIPCFLDLGTNWR
jgi:hypothetical protein